MAATLDPLDATMKQQNERSEHYYHAEAHVLSGELQHPIKQKLPRHAEVVLKNNRRADHLTEMVSETNLEGLISFTSGQSRVSGVKIDKRENWDTDHSGWVTLSTAVLEGLNVFEVITADRIVSQVSTEHAFVNGHVPSVTFLGTQFKNLEVNGFPIPVTLDLAFFGKRPEGDRPYLDELAFLRKVKAQTEDTKNQLDKEAKIKNQEERIEIPKDLKAVYARRLTEIDRLVDDHEQGRPGSLERSVTCSLVKHIGKIELQGVKSFGNVLVIPNFGWVALAEVEVGIKPAEDDPYSGGNGGSSKEAVKKASNYFNLKMLDMHLGCIGGGNVTAGGVSANGHTHP